MKALVKYDNKPGCVEIREMPEPQIGPDPHFIFRTDVTVIHCIQMGRIPPEGATFEHEGTRYTITSAEPQKVNRVKIELPAPKSATTPAAPTTAATPAPSAKP